DALTGASTGAGRTNRRGRPSKLSVAQIESAQEAQASYIRRTGRLRGSIEAAYRSLGPNTICNSAFRTYFDMDGLSPHGKKMLELTRWAESMVALQDESAP
ncbi:MAG TPA: hypothetical protein VFL86_08745, partial [Burkholderiaceae bacterium]|nr:hypothetical protein [Burkholderiaceae bacterium]